MGAAPGSLDRRYERKLRAPGVELARVESLLRRHPALLLELHPPRNVHNLYLDTLRHTHFADHVDGVSTRQKVRVRWYDGSGRDATRLQLEFKRKVGSVIEKRVFRLSPAPPLALPRPGALRELLDKSECPRAVHEAVAMLQPALVNAYRRRYLLSADGRVRVTIDTDMTFRPPDRLGTGLVEDYRDRAVIVEVKYSERDVEAGSAVCEGFPLPLTKNSKYVNGLGLLRGGG